MLPRRFHTLIAALLAISAGLSCRAENIRGAKQLFIDSRILSSLGGAKRVFRQAVKTGPLLSASTAWETKRSLAYPTVRREGPNSWKMWYRAGTPSGERAICYATSKDGVTWTKPKLGIYPHNGGNNNTVLIGSETFVDTSSVFKEDDGYYLYCIEGDVRYVIYHSPDGIHNWRKPDRGLHADHARIVRSGTHAPASHNYDICLGVYDPYEKDYILHFKVAHKEKLFGPNDWQRKFCQHRYRGSLARIQDTPFPLLSPRHELADKTDEALEPGTLRAQNYGMGMYPQEDGSVIGFSWLFSIDGHNGLVSTGGDGTGDGFWHYGPLNVMLVYSRDINGPWLRPTKQCLETIARSAGLDPRKKQRFLELQQCKHYSGPLRTPILPRGPAGSWDGGMVHTANTPVEVPKAETNGATTDQVWMYYGGANHLHNRNPSSGERDHRFGIAKWRIDGFAALEDTDGEEDTITSRAIQFSGNQLTLNADVKSNGYIKVKFRPAEAGADLKGWSDAVTGDHQKHIIRWGGEDDLGNCAGQEVILEFRVKDAALYSLDFTPDA